MKKEYPLLFTLFCMEIYSDVDNIEDIKMPDLRSDDFVIYIKDNSANWTPKEELNGWVFDNGVVLNVYNLEAVELKLKQLKK